MSDQKPKDNRLIAENLHAYYGDAHILQGCSLEIENECVAILGRNGMGKTTFMRALIGLTPPKEGSVKLGGIELVGKQPFEIAKLGLGYVPQGRRLFPSLSVEEHLTLTYRKTDDPNGWTPKKVFELFPEIARRSKISGTKLSGGEQQMLAIGRALVTNPRIIILDEPSEGLSPVAVERVVETCRELIGTGMAVLLVEQNIHVAESLADRVYVLDKGRTVHSDTMKGFRQDPNLRLKYLGI